MTINHDFLHVLTNLMLYLAYSMLYDCLLYSKQLSRVQFNVYHTENGSHQQHLDSCLLGIYAF
jgi:hypothetical protein